MEGKSQEPWEVAGVPWKSEAAAWGWVRGELRKGWSRHPVKLSYVKRYRKRVPNPNPNGRNETVWGMTCRHCEEDFAMPIPKKTKDKIKREHGIDVVTIEINHKNAASSLRCKEDLEGFAGRLLYVNFDDLEPLCKTCHDVYTYMERHGISFAEASLEKLAIAFSKLPITKQQEYLLTKGVKEGNISNAKRRREAYKSLMELEEK